MQKFLLLSFVLSMLTIGATAQQGCTSKTTPTGDVVFYGIDYSLVRFSYVQESAIQIIDVLPQINNLFINEAKKYDVQKLMGKNVVKTSLVYAKSVTDNLSESQLIFNGDYQINEDDIKKLIKDYPDSDDAGIGLVFIAEQMNKQTSQGSYYVTFFDLKTKEVLSTCRQTAKAMGFGLRNFWAGSVYGMMKAWK